MCKWEGLLAVVYFAVGPLSLRKATLSARSAKDNGGVGVRTMLVGHRLSSVDVEKVTDDDGLRRSVRGVASSPFDTIESIGHHCTYSSF